MNDKTKQLLLSAGAAVAVIIIISYFWSGDSATSPDSAGNQPTDGGPLVMSTENMLHEATGQPDEEVVTPQVIIAAPTPKSPLATTPKPQTIDSAAAIKLYRHGQSLADEGKLIEARTALSSALFSNALESAQADNARATLADLAEHTLFSQAINPNDPYTMQYTVQPGDRLSRIERNLKLHVPTQLLCKVNRIENANAIRADQTMKLVKGPFHAVVSLTNFTMDIYLHRQGLPYIFIKRLPVGLGKQGTTPAGSWRVGLGRKMIKPPWNPPPNSERTGTILYGQPGYAFGTQGLWIGLEGADPKTRLMRGYGIHSTRDSSSIGTAVSLGCIRLADDDIDLVFRLLYEKWSTVVIKNL